MLYNTYKESLASSSSNRQMNSNYNSWPNQAIFGEKLVGWFLTFWHIGVRNVGHFVVVPPLIASAKRLQYEQTLKKNQENYNGINDPNEHEEFYIDYKVAARELLHRLFSEFIGTMILTTIIGANLLESRLGLILGQTAALNNGLVILILIYALGVVSGAHLNPVVTLGFTLRRVFPLTWLPLYILSQFVGSIIGGLLIRGLFGGQYASLATNSVDTSQSTLANAFKWEIWLTFCLVFIVLLTATKSAVLGSQAAIAVGAVLAVGSVIGGPQSSASMNPWRTLGPSIINNSLDNRHSLWVFIAGPTLGSIVAYVAVNILQGITRKRTELSSAYGEKMYDESDVEDHDTA